MENHLVSLLWQAIYFLVLDFLVMLQNHIVYSNTDQFHEKNVVITDYHCYSYLELAQNNLLITNSLLICPEFVRVPPLKP